MNTFMLQALPMMAKTRNTVLTDYEYAFYTAVANNDSAKELMQQDKLIFFQCLEARTFLISQPNTSRLLRIQIKPFVFLLSRDDRQ